VAPLFEARAWSTGGLSHGCEHSGEPCCREEVADVHPSGGGPHVKRCKLRQEIDAQKGLPPRRALYNLVGPQAHMGQTRSRKTVTHSRGVFQSRRAKLVGEPCGKGPYDAPKAPKLAGPNRPVCPVADLGPPKGGRAFCNRRLYDPMRREFGVKTRVSEMASSAVNPFGALKVIFETPLGPPDRRFPEMGNLNGPF